MHKLRWRRPTALLARARLSAARGPTRPTVTWQNRVVVAKKGAHCADDPNCFNRYHPAIEPVARANPGDLSSSRRATPSTAT